MSLPRSVAEVLNGHVTLEVEGIDRMYLNVYVPGLQREQGVATFFRFHRGHQFASSALMDPISKTFVAALEGFAKRQKIPVIQFRKGRRKDDVAAEQRKKFTQAEGVVFIGKAQEKTRVFRTERRRNEKTGATYPWLVRSTAMVNHFYIYCLDDNFGPFFLKFSTYFPYNAKLCLNGHEYAKRQLARLKAGIYPVTLSLIPSFGACTRSCLVPRYRSVVWTDAWPRSNWICSSSPPAARHIFAQLRLLRSWGAIPGTPAAVAYGWRSPESFECTLEGGRLDCTHRRTTVS
jgi:hypothetical protein